MSNCFPRFIVRWILNFLDQPSHENHENWYPKNKSDFTVLHLTQKDVYRKMLYETWVNIKIKEQHIYI